MTRLITTPGMSLRRRMRNAILTGAWLVLLVATAPAREVAGDDRAPVPVEIAPADTPAVRTPGAPFAGGPGGPSLAGSEDHGAFHLYVNEQPILTESFDWSNAGNYHSEYDLTMAGQSIGGSLDITCDSTGTWSAIVMQTPAGPVNVARDGAVARVTQGTKTIVVDLRPGTILWENFNPALARTAVRTYDRTKGGRQIFPLFIVPTIVMDASLEFIDSIERDIAGKDVSLDRYHYALPGATITFLVDAQGRVVFAEVPAQHAMYVRDGFEALMKPAETDTLLSAPSFEVTLDAGVAVPMRDGVRLAADIYRPRGEGTFPVVLVRTPYKKEMNEIQARYYARRGYVVCVQDCRGRFASPGDWEPFMNEAKDGYDTIEWLAAQPWSNGRVGMIGASYLGWVQWWAARERPPHLVTIIPNVSPPDPWYNIPYEYGVFFLTGAIWWADVLETEATADISGTTMRRVGDKHYETLLRALPVIDLDLAVLGHRNEYWRRWIEHPANDAWWDPANFLDQLDRVDIPVFHQSGWFDGDGIGTKLNYARMAAAGHRNQRLVLGPWGHTDTATRSIGFRDFGDAAVIDLQRDYLRWFDHWLKGIDNGIDREPPVSVFVMGSNRWLHGDAYPLSGTRMTPWYLGPAGTLTTTAPLPDSPPDRYTYDPGDPTPSPYWYVNPDTARTEISAAGERAASRANYAKVLTERRDILVYDTPALSESLTFTGPLEAVLYASSSARDTDWFMRVSEVDAEGEVFALTEGKIRARYRLSSRHPKALTPGKVYEYHIDLWQTGITIPKGRRLRVEVASASFPFFSRNLNTGGKNEVETAYMKAEQAIYHDAKHPSRIILPVIPGAMMAGTP